MPHQMRSETSRQNILLAAQALFLDHGYDGVSLKRVAAACGMTDAGIAYHFPSKRALYDAVLADRPADQDWSAVRDKDALIEQILERQRSWHGNADTLGLILLGAFNGDASSLETLRDLWTRSTENIATVLRAVSHPRPEIAAQAIGYVVTFRNFDAFLSSGHGYAKVAATPEFEDLVRRLLNVCLHGRVHGPLYPAEVRDGPRPAAAIDSPMPARPGTATSRPRPSKREHILDVALRLFSERGTEAITTRELAAASGISEQGLFYHFRSKRALVDAVLEERNRVPAQSGIEPVPSTSPLTSEHLAETALAVLATVTEDAEYVRLLARESMRAPAANELRRERLRTAQQLLEAQFDGRFTRVEASLLSEAVISLCGGIVLQRRSDPTADLSKVSIDPLFDAHFRELLGVVAPLDAILASRGQHRRGEREPAIAQHGDQAD